MLKSSFSSSTARKSTNKGNFRFFVPQFYSIDAARAQTIMAIFHILPLLTL